MNVKWLEPPEWWVKWKPLRWVLAILVVYWFFGTLLPRLRETPPVPANNTQQQPSGNMPANADTPGADNPVPEPETASAAHIAEPAPPTPSPAAKTQPAKPAATASKPPAADTGQPLAEVPAKAAPEADIETEAETEHAESSEPDDPRAIYTAVETNRVELINSLRSYESLEAIQALLSSSNLAAELSTISRDLPDDRYPPYRSDTLLIRAYKHADIEGQLTLEFFNDRLYQAHFVPKQPGKYIGWLRSHGTPLPIKRTGRSSLKSDNLEVTSNIDFAETEVGTLMRTTPYVQWTDIRLAEQMRTWGPVR